VIETGSLHSVAAQKNQDLQDSVVHHCSGLFVDRYLYTEFPSLSSGFLHYVSRSAEDDAVIIVLWPHAQCSSDPESNGAWRPISILDLDRIRSSEKRAYRAQSVHLAIANIKLSASSHHLPIIVHQTVRESGICI
jgi:hypothetical protein